MQALLQVGKRTGHKVCWGFQGFTLAALLRPDHVGVLPGECSSSGLAWLVAGARCGGPGPGPILDIFDGRSYRMASGLGDGAEGLKPGLLAGLRRERLSQELVPGEGRLSCCEQVGFQVLVGRQVE